MHILPDLKRSGGGGRRHDDIAHLKGLIVFGTYLLLEQLGLLIVGVIIAGGQHEGPQHNAALYLIAKALTAGLFVHIIEVGIVFGTESVLHPIEAGKIGGCLRRGNDIVGGKAVIGTGQTDIHHLGASGLQRADNLPDGGAHRYIGMLIEFPRHTDAQPGKVIAQPFCGLGISGRHGGRVIGVLPADGIKQVRHILHAASHRADLVKRGGKRHQPVTGNRPVGGLQADDPAVGRRLTDRTAGIPY